MERPLAPVPVCSISIVLIAVCVVISDYSRHQLIPVLRSMTTGIFKQARSPTMHHSGSPKALLPSEELTAAFQLASLHQTCCRNLSYNSERLSNISAVFMTEVKPDI